MNSTRHYFMAALLLLMLAVAAAFFYNSETRQPAVLQNATLLPEPRAIRAFELTDQSGETFDQSDLQGRWTLLFFGFTHCPDICPITLQQLLTVRAALQAQGSAPLPEVVLVSVDPARDTLEALDTYVANFRGELRAARAELETLRQLSGDLGIFFERGPGEDDSYEVSHSAAVLLINPRGELHAIFSAPQNVQALVHDLPIVMAAL